MSLVTISQAQGRVPVTIFHLKDRVNLGNFAELEETARAAYDQGVRNLIIDLSGVVSLTSIGIRAIVVIHKMFSEEGDGQLKIVCPIDYLREVLEIAGVNQYIEIHEALEEAIKSF